MAYSTAEAWIINLRYDVLRSDCVIMSTQRTARVGRVYTLGSACGRRDIGHGLRDWRPRPFGSGEVPLKEIPPTTVLRLRTDETLPLRPCRARLHLPANASDVGCSSCSPLRQPRSRDAPLARMAAAAHVPCPARPIGSPRLSRVRGCAHASCPPASGRHPLPSYEKGGFLVHVGIEFRCGLPC